MAKIISVINQKGGVGKTTTAVNVSASLGLRNKKVLLIDIDPQGNSTSGLGIHKKSLKTSLYDVLVNGVEAYKALIKTQFQNLFLLPSSLDLAGAEIELIEFDNRAMVLKEKIKSLEKEFDYIIIDCPPSLGIITINVLSASKYVLVPVQCEYYALEGLSQLINSIKRIKQTYNNSLELTGVILTMFDARLNLTQQVVDEVKRCFQKKLFDTTIPRSVKLSEAPSYGEPICYYDKSSKGALAYEKLTDELLVRIK